MPIDPFQMLQIGTVLYHWTMLLEQVQLFRTKKSFLVFRLLPLCLPEVGSWWAGHRQSQLGNHLSDWSVH